MNDTTDQFERMKPANLFDFDPEIKPCETTPKSNRGGSREGAGRPNKWGKDIPSKNILIPAFMETAVTRFIAEYITYHGVPELPFQEAKNKTKHKQNRHNKKHV